MMASQKAAQRPMNLQIEWPPRFVRLLKVAAVPNPSAPTMEASDYNYGAPNLEGSLPVNYTIDGWLLGLPQTGEPVRVLRVARGGVVLPGIYSSTKVVDVPGDGVFLTMNSVYHWREIGVLRTPHEDN